MLQVSPAQGSHGHEPVSSSSEIWRAFLSFLRRRSLTILLTAVLVVACGAAYLAVAPVRYAATAQILLDSRQASLFDRKTGLGEYTIDSSTSDSQIEILKSENILNNVIRDLRLEGDPEFSGTGTGPFAQLWKVIAEKLGEPVSAISTQDLQRRTLRTMKDNLSVRRVGLTYVLEIRYRSLSAERAAQIANAIADTYLVDQLDSKYQAARRANSWMLDRLRELREQAANAEQAVAQYKNDNNIIDAGNGRIMTEQRIGELNTQLVLARAQTSDARAKLSRIEHIIESGTPEGAVTDSLKNDVVSKLRSQYLDLAGREHDWSERYGANHLAAIDLRNRMREIRRSILDELRRTAETYKSDYQIALERENSARNEMDEAIKRSQSTNYAQVALRELESAAQTYRTMYNNFLTRQSEAVQQQSFPITEARIITRATAPYQPSDPLPLIVMPISVVAGLIFGFMIGVAKDATDRGFRSTRDVEGQLNLPVLAMVPFVPAVKFKVNGKDPPRGTFRRVADPAWNVLAAPLSRFSEALRSLKVGLEFGHLATRSCKVIGLTSALPGEGKTVISASFALTLAQAGRNVLLIDGDLRNSALSRKLWPNRSVGVTDVISGKSSLAEAVLVDPVTGLNFLPCHGNYDHGRTSDLIGSDGMSRLIDEAKKKYEYIIIDLSPLAPIVDVRAAVEVVDGFVLVIEWGETSIEVVRNALQAAPEIQPNLVGVVLSKVKTQALSRYDRESRAYYSHVGYERYGIKS